jgi:hypothetical protein
MRGGPRGADHRHLSRRLQQRFHPCGDSGVGFGRGRKLHQRHEIGWVEPMGIEKTVRMDDSADKIVSENGRCGRCNDRGRSRHSRGACEHLALEVEHFRHPFENDRSGRKRRRCCALRHYCHPACDRGDMALVEQPEAREAGKGRAHLLLHAGGKVLEIPACARLEVDDRHIMPGIGEHDGDAAPHPAGTEARDRRARAHANPVRKTC